MNYKEKNNIKIKRGNWNTAKFQTMRWKQKLLKKLWNILNFYKNLSELNFLA